MPGPLIKIYRQLAENLSVTADAIFPSFEQEAVHRFRVAYKKLRAFLRMTQQAGQENHFKMPGEMKRIYVSMGIVRDVQLQQGLIIRSFISTLNQVEDYLNSLYHTGLRQLLPLKKKQLLAVYQRHTDKLTEIIDEDFTQEQLSTYILHFMESIRDMLYVPDLTDEQLHQVRKKLKDAYYNLSLFPDCNPAEGGSGMNLAVLDKLAHQLGEFQDYSVSLRLLRNYLGGPLQDAEKKVLGTLGAELALQQVLIKQRTIIALRNTFLVSPRADVHG